MPAAVVALANRLLPTRGVNVPGARSRRIDGAPHISTIESLGHETERSAMEALRYDQSINVIIADMGADGLAEALRDAGLPVADIEIDGRVTALPASLAKGLEHDHVIAVEPADIVAAEARGLNRLFVVLTRAVSRLEVLHAQPLPTPLDKVS
ncbi:hypothetical protein Drose_00770 [Dactylosporangium roseum]|uniref:DNA helicase n=1 Tax=Dactylosporangium roseum TaxID=47989 RepID=A0ABY5Z4C2_9ACTN|nr:hypothetical protein [Dactylosporangium roseum]UWZ36908.1 hypothetical protein Drose_00770 [Dactylosporangium roseum]